MRAASIARSQQASVSLADTTAYLVELRAPLRQAFETRRAWICEIRALLEQARCGDVAGVLAAAGRVGRDYGDSFFRCRERLNELTPPPDCRGLHDSALAWFDELVLACRILEHASASGQLHRIAEANVHLVAASQRARGFNAEYASTSGYLLSLGAEADRDAPSRRTADPPPTA